MTKLQEYHWREKGRPGNDFLKRLFLLLAGGLLCLADFGFFYTLRKMLAKFFGALSRLFQPKRGRGGQQTPLPAPAGAPDGEDKCVGCSAQLYLDYAHYLEEQQWANTPALSRSSFPSAERITGAEWATRG